MKTFPYWSTCRECDSVYTCHRPLSSNEKARCQRCQSSLTRHERINTEGMLALILTTFIVFVIANVFPVISVSFQGVRNSITLWQASLSLAHWPLLPLALVTLWSLLIVPLLQIVLLGWVMVFACKGRAAPGFIIAMKTLNWLRPWSWVEVAMLAFLIAGIKLSGPLDVITGPGSWAMLAFMMLIIPITHKDIQSLWMYVSIRIPDND